MGQAKTNAMRMLDKAKLSYAVHTYDHSDGKIDGASVARKLGQDANAVYKTLVTKGASGGYFVFVIPVEKELDMKKAAHAAGEKSVSMLPLAQLTQVTGYVRGGCSPVGMKKQFPTYFDEAVVSLPAVIVSGGRLGCQIEIAPDLLMALIAGKAVPLVAEESAR